MLYTWEILKNNLVSKGIKDWQKYLPKREAVIAEMQKQEQEAQARAASGHMMGREQMRQAIAQKLSPQGASNETGPILPTGRG